MPKTNVRLEARDRRHQRVRKNIAGTADRPRLCVYKSLHHIYAQLVDDTAGHTLLAASTVEETVADGLTSKTNMSAATAVGKAIGERAVAKGIQSAVFDRSGYPYHGRLKALADAAREAGLAF